MTPEQVAIGFIVCCGLVALACATVAVVMLTITLVKFMMKGWDSLYD